MLDGFFLHYFKTDKDKVPAGSIDLKSSKGTTVLDPSGSRWAFELITPERVYYIEADSEKIRSEWLEALEDTFTLVKPFTGVPSGAGAKSAYLEKRGEGNKSWKRRFFVLEGPRIKYYKDAKAHKVLGTIDLGLCRGMRKTPAGKTNRPHCFDLFTSHRVFSFAAETEAEVDSWLAVLADAVPDDPTPRGQKKPASAEEMVISHDFLLLFCFMLFFYSFLFLLPPPSPCAELCQTRTSLQA